jgi:hypothetical protein
MLEQRIAVVQLQGRDVGSFDVRRGYDAGLER